MKQVEIYTDGACSGNPGPGGWAAILIYRDKRAELSGYEAHTTNNRMELMAAKKPVENQDLWQELLILSATHAVEWVKVRGHADNPGNNRCDELARGEIKQHAGVEKR